MTRLGPFYELQASGKFRIIEDIQIRNAVNELQQSYVLSMDIMENIQDILTMTQFDLEHFFVIGPDYDPNDPYLRSVKLDFDAIQNNTVFLARLTSHLKLNKILLTDLHRHNESTKAVEALLRTQIEVQE